MQKTYTPLGTIDIRFMNVLDAFKLESLIDTNQSSQSDTLFKADNIPLTLMIDLISFNEQAYAQNPAIELVLNHLNFMGINFSYPGDIPVLEIVEKLKGLDKYISEDAWNDARIKAIKYLSVWNQFPEIKACDIPQAIISKSVEVIELRKLKSENIDGYISLGALCNFIVKFSEDN